MLAEITVVLVLELEFSSDKIRDKGGVRGSGGVGTSSKIFDMLDA
jgi:hypothetical protein